MNIVTIDQLSQLIKQHGLQQFLKDLRTYLIADFKRWHEFTKAPRHAAHLPNGVIELMPVYDDQYYAFKYVNGHPDNPKTGKATVVALGILAEVTTGYPLLISEMTLLTALRTAATAAIATDLLAKPNASKLVIIGTGSQSELQVIAAHQVRPLTQVIYADLDPTARQRFADHLTAMNNSFELKSSQNLAAEVANADIVITATAAKQHAEIIQTDWVKAGTHITGLGGDCPGKTELPPSLLKKCRIAIEYWPQTSLEGEIQQLTEHEAKIAVCGELWELISQQKKGRISNHDITLFDSVGFALEDFSALRLVYDLSRHYSLNQPIDLIPQLADPKNLFSLVK